MIDLLVQNSRAVFLISFVLLLAGLIWLDRKSVKRKSILFFRKTEKGIKEIDKIAKAAPRFWKIYGTLGVFIGIITIFISLGLIGSSVYDFGSNIGSDTNKTVEGSGSPKLVLPGVSDQYDVRPGVLFVPAEYWIISVGILMFFHEMSHAIVARTEDFEINSVGWVVIGILPGAFVEPKGDQMLEEGEFTEANTSSDTGLWDQGNWKSRLKVLCAGSWANYIIAGIFLLGFFGMTQTNVYYGVQDGFPAQGAGMNNGTVNQVNGEMVRTTEHMVDSLENISVGEEVKFSTSEGNFTVEAVEHPEEEEGGYIGIRFGENRTSTFEDFAYPGFIAWLVGLIGTIAFLNLAIGLFNMLPAKPLDGGQVVDTFVREFKGEEYVHYVNKFSLLVWLVILGTLVGSVIIALI